MRTDWQPPELPADSPKMQISKAEQLGMRVGKILSELTMRNHDSFSEKTRMRECFPSNWEKEERFSKELSDG